MPYAGIDVFGETRSRSRAAPGRRDLRLRRRARRPPRARGPRGRRPRDGRRGGGAERRGARADRGGAGRGVAAGARGPRRRDGARGRHPRSRRRRTGWPRSKRSSRGGSSRRRRTSSSFRRPSRLIPTTAPSPWRSSGSRRVPPRTRPRGRWTAATVAFFELSQPFRPNFLVDITRVTGPKRARDGRFRVPGGRARLCGRS